MGMVMIHTVCIRIRYACMTDGGTVLALPLLTEYMTQALYRHMLQLTSTIPPDRPLNDCYKMRPMTYTYIHRSIQTIQLCTGQADLRKYDTMHQKLILRHATTGARKVPWCLTLLGLHGVGARKNKGARCCGTYSQVFQEPNAGGELPLTELQGKWQSNYQLVSE